MTAASPQRGSNGNPSPSLAHAATAAAASPLFHFVAGKRLFEAGNAQQAVAAFDAALALCPTFAEAWARRGEALEAISQPDAAYESFAQAVILTPGFVQARSRLFLLASQTGRPASIMTPWPTEPAASLAARLWRRVSALVPHREKPRIHADDEATLRARLLEQPKSAEIACDLGGLLMTQGRTIEAELFLRYALALKPWCGEAALWLGVIFENVPNGSLEFNTVLTEVLKAGGRDARLYPMALWHKLWLADWDGYDKLFARSVEVMKRDPLAGLPFMSLMFADDPILHKRTAIAYATQKTRHCTPLPQKPCSQNKRPLTIGYLSADFREHACATLFAELFDLHDRRDFRIHAYSTWRDDGFATRKRLVTAADKFVDLYGVEPAKAAEEIANSGADVLVDLTGYTVNEKSQVLARKPAPIQVNFLGYPGTLGLPAVDYAIVDPIVAPDEGAFTEALVYMPECYQVNDRRRKAADSDGRTRADYGLPSDGTVFCSFNDLRKMTPHVFGMWMKLLAAVPGSVLWLLAPHDAARANLRAVAADANIDPARVIFAERLRHHQHLARYRFADVALDTHPYGSHTTASDALWMGCPVVTYLGSSFPARVAASILHAAELPDLVATTWDGYCRIATRIATDVEYCAALRARLSATKDTCVLFDSGKFTRRLEWIYQAIWERRCRDESPSRLDVPTHII